MTRYMDIPKIPGPIYTTLIDRKIAIIQRSTGPIVHSSIDGYGGVTMKYQGWNRFLGNGKL